MTRRVPLSQTRDKGHAWKLRNAFKCSGYVVQWLASSDQAWRARDAVERLTRIVASRARRRAA